MNNKINIAYMTNDAIETLRENQNFVTDKLKNNKIDANWIKEIYSGNPFEEKNYKIFDFELKKSDNGNYSEVDLENSIVLYETLKDLPRYVLTDERFWAWINFTKGYRASLQAMPIKSDNTFGFHWLFKGGNRRGLFFGVMSRCFFRVDLSVDERLEDKYELTKFIIENPERFRNLSWRSSSSEKHIVLGVLKAEKAIYEKYINDPKYSDVLKEKEKGSDNIYTKIAVHISLYASVRLIDAIKEEDIFEVVYNKMEDIILNDK